jgi:hypothetical protein
LTTFGALQELTVGFVDTLDIKQGDANNFVTHVLINDLMPMKLNVTINKHIFLEM